MPATYGTSELHRTATWDEYVESFMFHLLKLRALRDDMNHLHYNRMSLNTGYGRFDQIFQQNLNNALNNITQLRMFKDVQT